MKWTLFPTPKRNEAGLEEEDGGNDGMSVGVAAPGGEREGRSVHGLVVREAPPNDALCSHTCFLALAVQLMLNANSGDCVSAENVRLRMRGDAQTEEP